MRIFGTHHDLGGRLEAEERGGVAHAQHAPEVVHRGQNVFPLGPQGRVAQKAPHPARSSDLMCALAYRLPSTHRPHH